MVMGDGDGRCQRVSGRLPNVDRMDEDGSRHTRPVIPKKRRFLHTPLHLRTYHTKLHMWMCVYVCRSLRLEHHIIKTVFFGRGSVADSCHCHQRQRPTNVTLDVLTDCGLSRVARCNV
jgi:hypothetical protein